MKSISTIYSNTALTSGIDGNKANKLLEFKAPSSITDMQQANLSALKLTAKITDTEPAAAVIGPIPFQQIRVVKEIKFKTEL